ncbi:hypothetical protein IBX73_09510, partial [candidate division WOR-3 bacterium]|nr:hypothetical protein [candidate division WOR-3 bacterium]
MKSKAFFVLIILLPLCLNGGSVEKQIIVLFQPDVIGLPIGQRSAQLPEITAPQHVIECLQAIGAIMIARGLPDFEPDDTIRITQDGWVARLPNWAHLFVIELPAGTNRDSAVIIMENLDEVIYAEKNRRGEFFQTEPNDTYFKWYQRNLNDSTGNTGIDVMRAWD